MLNGGEAISMHRFEYHEFATLAQVTAFLEAHKDTAKVLAGGTDLLVQMRKETCMPHHIIDIKKTQGLNRMIVTAEGIEIGAAVSLYDAEKFLSAYPEYQVLCQAMHNIGSFQIRNRATVAGNICNASPAADTLPALVVLGARVKIQGCQGERSVPVEGFFAGPRRTVLMNGEVVSAILLPRLQANAQGVFVRKSRRPHVDLATVNIAVFREGRRVKIAMGAVAPTVVRALEAESFLGETGFSPETIAQAAKLAVKSANPISDIRGSREYRLQLIEALTTRALDSLLSGEEM